MDVFRSFRFFCCVFIVQKLNLVITKLVIETTKFGELLKGFDAPIIFFSVVSMLRQVTSSLTREDAALRLDVEGDGIFFTNHQRVKFNSHSGKQTS